ncbi:S9 family peptidase [Leptothermofonsia sichuanensis E412]|uniref:S9 family peptidase n=1 Tax=Leptothermofonsia sichuanensis TaxID=2917832 RepID=UPI001CA70CDB|nr:prolyl oligopeptidase family serine peptidase [Leptothermofonsia sichuanensis]QZZ19768.1 S9 family peptidase [Leptothermofonsia sichuanensis E412]
MNVHYHPCLKLVTLSLLKVFLTSPQGILATEPVKPLLPSQAQVKPKPITVINRKTAQQTALLSPEEIEKIKVLQATLWPQIISEISPDGIKVVVSWQEPGTETPSLHLLDIQNGLRIEITANQLQGFQPTWFYWQDQKTAIALASKPEGEGDEQYALIRLNSQNGRTQIEPLTLPGLVMSMAPDASKALVQIKPRSQTDGTGKAIAHDDEEAEGQPTEFRVLTLPHLEEVYRFALPPETTVHQASWTPDASRLAIVRSWFPQTLAEFSWGGTSLLARQSRDAMGLLSPAENPYLQKNALMVIDLQTRDRQVLSARQDGAVFDEVFWSPDGQTLLAKVLHPLELSGRFYPIYLGIARARNAFQFYTASLKPIGNLEAPELANFEDEGIFHAKFISTDEILFTALVGMDNHLYLYNRESSVLRRLPGKMVPQGAVAVDRESRQIVFQSSSFTEPPELYRMDLDNGRVIPLTALNQAASNMNQIRADPVLFTLANGDTLIGVIMQPADAAFPPTNRPLVVWQEGGPTTTMTNSWGTYVEGPYTLLPNFGINVLVLPLYGRYGFGIGRFASLYGDRNFGQVDVDAMAEVVQQAIARGYTSLGKVGITGCSYGGYFTLQSIIRHPTLYAAANPQCSWVDILADWTGDDALLPPFLYGNLIPYIDPVEFQKDSPVYNASQIQTPLLIFHGSHDRLPVAMLENIYWTVSSKGIPARMVKFIKAGHGLVSYDKKIGIPEYQLYAAQEMIQWFRTYLAGNQGSSVTDGGGAE